MSKCPVIFCGETDVATWPLLAVPLSVSVALQFLVVFNLYSLLQDQSQSLNIHLADPNYGKLTSMHFYSWKKGLKTGVYYLRRKPKHHAQQFTIAPKEESEPLVCRRIRRASDESECIVCGS